MMERKWTVLVTGVGAIIGYGIIQSLRKSHYDCKIIGIDIFKDAVGRVWCDEFIQGVRADSENYQAFIQAIINTHKIDMIIPAIEQDILALNGFRDELTHKGIEVVLNSIECIDTFTSKLKTSCFLEKNKLPALKTLSAEETSFTQFSRCIGLPCIAKPDKGHAGKGIEVLTESNQVEQYLGRKSYLLQEYISGLGVTEYTASVFGLGNGESVNMIIMSRQLGSDGATHKAEVVDVTEIEDQIIHIVSLIKPVGPTNFQFIFSPDTNLFYLLEINPRISSSTSIRTSFGVNEAAMCIQFFLEKKRPVNAVVLKGNAQRFIADYINYDNCTDL